MPNIFPDEEIYVTQSIKKELLGQNGIVIWLTGLSGSGKTTIAKSLEKLLLNQGIITAILDGDNIRNGINSNLGFSEEDRLENIRRVSEIAKLFAENNIVTICCFISPTESIRQISKDILQDKYYEIYLNSTFEKCSERDVKGLYEKAINGEIKNFTGLDSPFEIPNNPYAIIDTMNNSIEQSTLDLYKIMYNIIKE